MGRRNIDSRRVVGLAWFCDEVATYGDDSAVTVVDLAQRPDVRADERMLRQAILNLLRNAAEAISEESTKRSVFVRVHQENDPAQNQWTVIEIKDTGSGIPPEQLQKIFIPFFTTKPKGHGVGLALTHRVITQHGGTLTAANALDGGALFVIKLPC